MKTKLFRWIFIAVIVSLAFTTPLSKTLKIDKQKSKITVKGTSNLHDWEEGVTSFDGELNVKKEDNVITSYNASTLNFYSKSISSNNSIMDNKTRDALKVDKFPVINFKSQQIREVKDLKVKQQIVVIGNLTMAGITKAIEVDGINTILPNGGIYFEGKKEISMTDYGIDPPTALLGTLKVGNKVTIIFNIYFN